MKMKLVAVSVLGLVMTAPFAQADTLSLKTDTEKASYAIGWDLSQSIKKKKIEIVTDALTQGIKDGMSGGSPLLSEPEMHDVLKAFQSKLMAKAAASFEIAATENQKKGLEYIQANAKKPGVKSHASGLQYKMLKEGTGAMPTANDTVTVEYTGTTIDGVVFDSTDKAGQAATFPLSQVISCWTTGLQLMRVGGVMELTCPPSLAYGARSVSDVIGPNETLKFVITLKSIEKADKKKAK